MRCSSKKYAADERREYFGHICDNQPSGYGTMMYRNKTNAKTTEISIDCNSSRKQLQCSERSTLDQKEHSVKSMNTLVTTKSSLMHHEHESIYTGDFQCGKRHGLGILKSMSRNSGEEHLISTYTGMFQDDVRHGFGVLNTPDWEYMGEFKHGKNETTLIVINRWILLLNHRPDDSWYDEVYCIT